MRAARLYGLLGVCILGGALLLLMLPRAKEAQTLREENAQLASSERVIAALQQISIPSLVWDNVTLDEAKDNCVRLIKKQATNASEIFVTWAGGATATGDESGISCNIEGINAFDALRYLCEGYGCTCIVTYGNGVAQIPPDMSDDPVVMAKKVVVHALVRTFDLALPVDTCQWANILWYTFANRLGEMQFEQMTAKQWRSNWVSFAAALCNSALFQHLPFDALERCLTTVQSSQRQGIAYLPVGAYFVQANQRPVWIIVCKWECEDEGATLSHICIWALDADTGTVLSFVTCN